MGDKFGGRGRGVGLGLDEPDGRQVVSCVIHGKKRLKRFMVKRDDGTYECPCADECGLPTTTGGAAGVSRVGGSVVVKKPMSGP